MPTQKSPSSKLPAGYERLKGSERKAPRNASRLGPADPNETFSVTVVLQRRADHDELPNFDYFASTPISQRPRLGEKEFARRYGAHPDDIDKVDDFAHEHGLAITSTHTARRTVALSGTVSQMNRAFHVDLGRYQRNHPIGGGRRQRHLGSPTEIYRGREGFIHLPRDLAKVIVGVFGLDNRRVSHRGNTGDPPIVGTLSVEQVTNLYNVPAPGASIAEQTIGVISTSGGYGGFLQSDLDLYYASIGAPDLQVLPISVDGTPNGTLEAPTNALTTAGQNILTFASTQGMTEFSSVTGSGIPDGAGVMAPPTATTVSIGTYDYTSGTWSPLPVSSTVPAGTPIYFNLDGETNQDVQIATSAAWGAKAAVYFCPDTQAGWVDLIARAIHPDLGDFPVGTNPPSVLTSSWYISGGDDPTGLLDYGITVNVIEAMTYAFQDAALMGVTVCICTGDFGSNADIGRVEASDGTFEGDGYAHVIYPASDPWVLSVGGTTIGQYQPSGSTQLDWVEYSWNDPFNDPGYPWGTTGGGVSDFFSVPSYQGNASVPSSINLTIEPNAPFSATGRGVPDVAGNASINSGFSGLYIGGAPAQEPGNGTSASTPLWAGIIAVINSNLGFNVGFLNPVIYAIGSQAFCPLNPLWPDPADPQLAGCPVDNSNNGIPGYKTGAGWDACTGWGSPNGSALLSALHQALGHDCYLIVDQVVFGSATVTAEIQEGSPAVFENALFVVADEFTPNQLGITPAVVADPVVNPPGGPPQFSALPNGMTLVLSGVQPASSTLLAMSPDAPQRFTFAYDVEFFNTDAFPAAPDQTTPLTVTATVTATVNGSPLSVSGSAILQLDSDTDPYFAGGSATSWLSSDVRVFQLEPGEWTLQGPSGTVHTGITLDNTSNSNLDATTFIQAVVENLNIGPAAPNSFFDLISTDETSELDTLEFDPANNNAPVYNFAVARVRYNASAVSAKAVRVFFRLIPALTTSTAYDPTNIYRKWSDGIEFGQTVPLLGIDPSSEDVVAVPCFASPRVDASTVSLATQTDTTNVQQLAPPSGGAAESYAYFGCWLDINQGNSVLPASVVGFDPNGPFPVASLQSVSELLGNQHQCLVAEIAYDPDPIPEGYVPTFSGPLAQRNLSLGPVANPGEEASRRASNTFLVQTTASRSSVLSADQLMFDWTNMPEGSRASIYWPSVRVEEVVELAELAYANATLGWSIQDKHTFSMPVGGISYVPVPRRAETLPGLISIDLPYGIRRGQQFDAVVRQVTMTRLSVPDDGESVRERLGPQPSPWRRITGAFQVAIPVSTKEAQLEPAERLLSLTRWVERSKPRDGLWASVYERYVEQIADRVDALGGNASAIVASPTGGGVPLGGKRLEFTGRVDGLIYDHLGDFEGFLLRTDSGDEQTFHGGGERLGAIVRRAWEDRVVVTVQVNSKHLHVVEAVIFRHR
jgi:hypothetical protein